VHFGVNHASNIFFFLHASLHFIMAVCDRKEAHFPEALVVKSEHTSVVD
jgi:hypothetical protein